MPDRPARRFTRVVPAAAAAASALLMLLPAGCSTSGPGGTGGSMVSRSLAEDAAMLDAEFRTAIYAHEPGGDTVFILSDVPLDALLEDGLDRGQLLVLDLLWPPRAGSTPISADATNTSVRHLVVVDGQAGSYAGAGFAMPSGTLGDGAVSLQVWDSTVRLVGATEGFRDVLSPARLTGSVTATENEVAVRRIIAWLRVVSPPALDDGVPRAADAGA
jgi:hypothetical protein